MFRYMPRAGYRSGEKRVDVWLSLAGHGHLVALAAGWECSLSDAVARLVREKVSGDAGGDCAGVGRDVGADRRVSGFVEGGDGADSARVGSGDGVVPVVGGVPLWAREALSGGVAARHLAAVPDAATLDPDEWLDAP